LRVDEKLILGDSSLRGVWINDTHDGGISICLKDEICSLPLGR
jgi:hypothetical protein